MRIIVWAVTLMAVLWSGYWFMGASALRQTTETWLEARRLEGWRVETGGMDILGFPNRFDTTFQDVTVYDPRSGMGWTGEFFQVLALSYQPNHAIAVFPPRHSMNFGGQVVTFETDKMQASLVFGLAANAPLDRSTLIAEALTLRGADWTLRADQVRFATERLEGSENAVHLGLAADGLTPWATLKQQIDPDDVLPNALQVALLDAVIDFDRDWDRFALGADRPRPDKISLKNARVVWDDVSLGLSGDLDVSASGQLSGALTLEVENWRKALRLLAASGAVPDDRMPLVERAVETYATLTGGGATLSLPVTMRDGALSVAMFPVGPAPRLPSYLQ